MNTLDFIIYHLIVLIIPDDVDVLEELPTEIVDEPTEIIEGPTEMIDEPMDDADMIVPIMAIDPTFLRRTPRRKTVAKKSCRKPVTESNCHRPNTTKKPAPKKTLKKHLDKAYQPQVRNC